MLYRGFCGPSNPTQSVIADGEVLRNWYVERVESPFAPVGAALYPVPGASRFIQAGQITDVGARGGISVNGRHFVVVGKGFYEIFVTGLAIKRGVVAEDSNPATVSYNGPNGGGLLITSGGNGYHYALATNVLTTVLNGEATMGGMLNARFLAFSTVTGKVRMSALNDGTTWDPTLYFQRSQAPDPWQSMLVNPPEIWLIGEQTGEVWYDSGAFPQPFAPIPGAFFRHGTPAGFSTVVAGDYVLWLSKTQHGTPGIVAARGYSPELISNYAIANAITSYKRTATLSDCEVVVSDEAGHLFACFSFPQARETWCVDLQTFMWHQRNHWDPNQNRWDIWPPRVHLYAFDKHLVGDRATGTIAELDTQFGTEADGSAIRRLRVGPPLYAQRGKRLDISRFEVMAETGLGIPIGQGEDRFPKVMLRTSQNGKTWSPERLASAGKVGDYHRQIVFTQCGSSETLWFPEVSVSDPIPWRIAGADIDGSGLMQAAQEAA